MADYNDYYIIKTKTPPDVYYTNYVLKYKMYQRNIHDSNCKVIKKYYPDQCLGIAMIYAYGMYHQAYRVPESDIRNAYSKGSYFKPYSNKNKQAILNIIYNELVQNKPVVLQVNGNSKGTSRHYLTVVGFKKSIQKASDLTSEKQLYIMDSFPKQKVKCATKATENASAGGFLSLERRGRYMIPGYSCGSSPMYQYGYQVYLIH